MRLEPSAIHFCPQSKDYHQQYLADTKNPYGYCPDHGTGVSCPIGVVKASGAAEAITAEG